MCVCVCLCVCLVHQDRELEAMEAEVAQNRADLKLAFKRITDLQAALEEELDSDEDSLQLDDRWGISGGCGVVCGCVCVVCFWCVCVVCVYVVCMVWCMVCVWCVFVVCVWCV